MASVKEILIEEVSHLSEKDAKEILELIESRKSAASTQKASTTQAKSYDGSDTGRAITTCGEMPWDYTSRSRCTPFREGRADQY